MRTRTQTAALVVCLAVLSMQFVACNKDSAKVNVVHAVASNDNVVADSITDSSLLKGLVAWYTFDGDVLDHSGSKNNIVFNSAKPVAGKSGAPNTAYKFDGVSSYMQVNNKKSLNPLKISLYALVKVKGFYQGTCHGNRIISKGYDDNAFGRIDLGFDDMAYYNYSGCGMPVQTNFETFYGSYGDGSNASGFRVVNSYIQTGQWYSLVYTYDGIYSKLYVNGNLVGKVVKQTTFNANTSALYIGRNEDPGYPYYFNGIIDEIRIYNKVLSAAQVQALYNQSNN